MNTAHWHLILNHIPVIGIAIGTLSLITGLIFSSVSIKRLSMGILVAAALFAVPTYLTGEGAEDAVENLPGVTENIIERHESIGQTFLILCGVVGLLAFITVLLDWMQNKTYRLLYMVVLLGAAGTSIFAQQVGTSGGEIRHTEIRSGSSAVPPAGNEGGENNAYEKDED